MKFIEQYSKEKPRQFEQIFIVELTQTEIIALAKRYINKNLIYNPEAEKTLNDLRDLII